MKSLIRELKKAQIIWSPSLFKKFLIWLGFIQSEETKRILERWDYAKKHYGAKLTSYGFGRWRLTLEPKKVSQTEEFIQALEKARKIVECHNKK